VAQPVLLAGARTPIGRMLGSMSGLSAPELAGTAIRAALDRAGMTEAQVDAVIMGNVVQAGVGPNPARLAASCGGIPMDVPATTVNKLCLSGLAAVAQAAQLIAVGQCEVVVAGGMESMSNAPYLLARARRSLRYGDTPLIDALDQDALVCGFDGISMGAATERYQAHLGFSREAQDALAAESHARAVAAMKAGRLAEEIVPVVVSSPTGETTVEHDEGARPGATAKRLGGLRPAFSDNGTITAGSASQLSDGACAVVVMGKDRAQQQELPWLAELGSYGTVAGPDPSLLLQPARAIRDALRRDGTLGIGELDLIEINEAFAAVALASMRDLGVSPERVNVNGGAIALGHPVGMSGARLVLTLALELRRRGGGAGAAALCGGGGQGDALIIRAPAAGKDVLA
jgi:acetyl-CoA C-acetyltransferase